MTSFFKPGSIFTTDNGCTVVYDKNASEVYLKDDSNNVIAKMVYLDEHSDIDDLPNYKGNKDNLIFNIDVETENNNETLFFDDENGCNVTIETLAEMIECGMTMLHYSPNTQKYQVSELSSSDTDVVIIAAAADRAVNTLKNKTTPVLQ